MIPPIVPHSVSGHVAIIHLPAFWCSGHPQVPTSKRAKCHLDNPHGRGSRNPAFLVKLFSLRTVACSGHAGQKKGKNEGNEAARVGKANAAGSRPVGCECQSPSRGFTGWFLLAMEVCSNEQKDLAVLNTRSLVPVYDVYQRKRS